MQRRRPRPSGRTAGALAVLVLAACGPTPEAPAWPEGALLAARTESLGRLLEQLAGLEGTPLARRARALRAALPACAQVEARAPSGSLGDALAALDCAPEASPLAALETLRGERDLAFALPVGDAARLVGTLSLSPAGGVELELSLPAGSVADARRLLLPGATPAGAGVLTSDDALIHARLRPDGGLDLASLVAEDAQTTRLFRLKSALFEGAALDGTWEAAVYLPAPGRAMPDAALALGFSRRAPAVAALEAYLDEIQQTWPVHRSFFALGEARGACLLDLAVLPELAPCYVATERALVVGWNPESLRRALAPGPRRADGGIAVELARLPEADARLGGRLESRPTRSVHSESVQQTGHWAQSPEPSAETLPPQASEGQSASASGQRARGPAGLRGEASELAEGEPLAAGHAWPWRRLRADGAREGDAIRLRVVLEAGAPA